MPPPTSQPAAPTPDLTPTPFEAEADSVLRSLQPALASIIEHLRPPVMRPADLQKRLGLDSKLSWSVYHAATARDPRAVAAMLPGRRAMQRFFAAASLRGVPAGVIDRASRAFDDFEASVARHAGSRDAFQTMLAEWSGQASDAGGTVPASTGADHKYKRAAFRATALLWGRQAKVGCGIQILHPGEDGDDAPLDSVLIKGMVGLRRTRRSVPLHITAHHWRAAQSPIPPTLTRRREPLDPRITDPDAMWLLQDFCSRPLPEFRLRVTREGYRSHELVSTGLGASSEITYFTGEGRRGDTARPKRGGTPMWFSKAVDMPLEVLIQDIFIHRTLWDPTPPKVQVYAYPLDGSLEFREADLLPLNESAEYLGLGIDAGRTPIVPRYADMLAFAMNRMGWKEDEFYVFRCRVDYPVLYTRVRMTLE